MTEGEAKKLFAVMTVAYPNYRIERKEEVLIYEKQNCTVDFVGRL